MSETYLIAIAPDARVFGRELTEITDMRCVEVGRDEARYEITAVFNGNYAVDKPKY